VSSIPTALVQVSGARVIFVEDELGPWQRQPDPRQF
jgi:hypothetical protein